MTTACERTREALSQDRDDEERREHLAGCPDCRTWAEALDTVRYHAPALVPGPPEGLLAEIHEDLGLRRPPGPPDGSVPAAGWRRVTRPTPTGVAAAVVAGLVGVAVAATLTVGSGAADDPATTLTRVVETHAGRGTSFAFDLAGEVELRLPSGPATPGRRWLVGELARLADDGSAPDPAAARQVALGYRARGETDGQGVLRYELRWEVAAPRPVRGALEVVTVDGTHWLRSAGRPRWVRVPGSAGFDLGVVTVPHHLAEVLSRLRDVEEAGVVDTAELDDATVERVRARTRGGMVVDAWVGAHDGWLRRLRWIPEPPDDRRHGTTHGEVTARLHEHGRAREIDAPGSGRGLDEVPDAARPPFVAPDG